MRKRKNAVGTPDVGVVRKFRSKENYIQITTARGLTIWTNGGLGFNKEELEKALQKLDKDDRVIKVEVL